GAGSRMNRKALCSETVARRMRTRRNVRDSALRSPIGRARSLSRALAEQNDANRFEQDDEIENEGVVLDVIKIVFQLLDRLFDGRAVRVAHLGPPRQAGFDTVAHVIERNLLGQHRHELGSFGPRPDEAHLAFQDVQELGQFIDPRASEETPNARYARIVDACPARLAIHLRVLRHAAELKQRELGASRTDPLLSIDDRLAVFQHDEDGGQQHDGERDHEQHGGDGDIENTLHERPPPALAITAAINQPARFERFDRHLPVNTLEKARQIGHAHPIESTIEQRTQRQHTAALLANGDDDFVDAELAHRLFERAAAGDDALRRYDHLLDLVEREKSDEIHSRQVRRRKRCFDEARLGTGSEHEYTVRDKVRNEG